jgi:hypothetical protein
MKRQFPSKFIFLLEKAWKNGLQAAAALRNFLFRSAHSHLIYFWVERAIIFISL